MGQLNHEYRIGSRELQFDGDRAVAMLVDPRPITREWLIGIGGVADEDDETAIHFEWFSASLWGQKGGQFVVSPSLFLPPTPFAVVSTRGQFIAYVRLVLPGYQ